MTMIELETASQTVFSTSQYNYFCYNDSNNHRIAGISL